VEDDQLHFGVSSLIGSNKTFGCIELTLEIALELKK